MPGYGLDGARDAFERSAALFEGLVEEMAGPAYASLTHDELERHVEGRGRELLRQLFQDHADLRAVREERMPEVTGTDGVERTRTERGHARTLTTKFGDVTITRLAYRALGAGNLHPADAVWNLPAGKHSHGLAELAVREMVRGSFESAQAAIVRATGQRIGKRQIENMAVAAAVDIADFYTGRRPEDCDAGTLLVLTADGKGVVMRPEALREATARAAATSTGKLATRLSPGEKNGRKRMAELACVYDCEPVIRTVSDVITRPGAPRPAARNRPGATGKWLTASLSRDVPDVIADAFAEAARRDPGHARTWVVLVDGNRHQIEAIQAQAGHHNVKVHILIDFIHVAEYVWKAAWSFFDKGDPDAGTWVADRLRHILAGDARQVAAGIRRRATTYNFTGSERAGADQAAAYLSNNADRLAYDSALAAGWPISTGVIEGACRWLVKDRMDITGARWGLAGAEAILQLRALINNADFDTYWRFHLGREHDRNHLARHRQHQNDYTLAA